MTPAARAAAAAAILDRVLAGDRAGDPSRESLPVREEGPQGLGLDARTVLAQRKEAFAHGAGVPGITAQAFGRHQSQEAPGHQVRGVLADVRHALGP